MKQKVINFFGGPGAGKSTLGAALFAELKFRGHTPELVTEWIKDAEYEGRNTKESKLQRAQEYIWAKQHFRLAKLAGQVEWVVTDSPIIIGIAYKDPDYVPALEQAIIQSFHLYDNLNFFVKRTKEYVSIGRSQTHQEAIEKDEQIKAILVKHNLPFYEVEYHPMTTNFHIPLLMNELGWEVKPNTFGNFWSPHSEIPGYPIGHGTIVSGTQV